MPKMNRQLLQDLFQRRVTLDQMVDSGTFRLFIHEYYYLSFSEGDEEAYAMKLADALYAIAEASDLPYEKYMFAKFLITHIYNLEHGIQTKLKDTMRRKKIIQMFNIKPKVMDELDIW